MMSSWDTPTSTDVYAFEPLDFRPAADENGNNTMMLNDGFDEVLISLQHGNDDPILEVGPREHDGVNWLESGCFSRSTSSRQTCVTLTEDGATANASPFSASQCFTDPIPIHTTRGTNVDQAQVRASIDRVSALPFSYHHQQEPHQQLHQIQQHRPQIQNQQKQKLDHRDYLRLYSSQVELQFQPPTSDFEVPRDAVGQTNHWPEARFNQDTVIPDLCPSATFTPPVPSVVSVVRSPHTLPIHRQQYHHHHSRRDSCSSSLSTSISSKSSWTASCNYAHGSPMAPAFTTTTTATSRASALTTSNEEWVDEDHTSFQDPINYLFPYKIPSPKPIDTKDLAVGNVKNDQGATADTTVADCSINKVQHKQNQRLDRDVCWAERYQELRLFVQRHGHCRIPIKLAENQGLSQWAKRQRYQYKIKLTGTNKRTTMTDHRQRLLDDLGFVWDVRDSVWDTQFQKLVDYKQRYGHCNVPIKFSEDPKLGTWVKCQRRQYRLMRAGDKSSNITPDRVERLNRLGFVWRVGKEGVGGVLGPKERNEAAAAPTTALAVTTTHSFRPISCDTVVDRSVASIIPIIKAAPVRTSTGPKASTLAALDEIYMDEDEFGPLGMQPPPSAQRGSPISIHSHGEAQHQHHHQQQHQQQQEQHHNHQQQQQDLQLLGSVDLELFPLTGTFS